MSLGERHEQIRRTRNSTCSTYCHQPLREQCEAFLWAPARSQRHAASIFRDTQIFRKIVRARESQKFLGVPLHVS